MLKAAKVPSWRRPSPHTMVWGNGGGGAAAHAAAAQAVTAIVDGELLLACELGFQAWLMLLVKRDERGVRLWRDQ